MLATLMAITEINKCDALYLSNGTVNLKIGHQSILFVKNWDYVKSSFVFILHYLIIIIMQTFLKALNT